MTLSVFFISFWASKVLVTDTLALVLRYRVEPLSYFILREKLESSFLPRTNNTLSVRESDSNANSNSFLDED